MLKALHARTSFEASDVVFAWQAQGIVDIVKSEQRVRQRCIFRGKRSTSCTGDMFIRAVRRSLADFLRGVAFWSIRSVGLLR